MSGLTATGFDIKTLEELLAEIEAEQRAALGNNLNTSSASVLGQINAIYAAKLREIWELVEEVYASAYPDTASGQALSYLAALTGTLRRAATYSTVTATLNVNDGVTIPAGSAATVDGNNDMRYETTEDYTNTSGVTANVDLVMTATTAGSTIRANAGTLTVIATPVSGWNSVTNAEDSDPGLDEETDVELRERRETELQTAGTATLNAIRADLIDVEDVTSVTVFENVTDEVNAEGMPPHSIECLVVGGDDQDIWDQILLSKPAGTLAYGSETGTSTDSAGNDHEISFSRPSVVEVWLELDLDVVLTDYVGNDAVKEALADWGLTLALGEDVVIAKVIAAVANLAGVEDVTAVRAGFTASPAGTVNLTIEPREQAEIDTSRITIVPTSV